MPELPLPPPALVEAVIVRAPRLAPLGGEAAFSAVEVGADVLKLEARADEVLKAVPGVSLFRRTGSGAANPTTQGISLRAIAPSGAGRALVTLDGAPLNDPFGGWVIWSATPPEALDGASVVRGAGAGPYGAGALTGVVALRERAAPDGLAALDVSYGSRDSRRVALATGGSGVLFTASGSHSDGYYAVRWPRRGAADKRLSLNDAAYAVRAQRRIGEVEAALRLSAFQVRQGAGLIGARSTASGASAVLTLAQPAPEGVGGWRLQGWVRGSDLENTSVAVAADRSATTPANDQYSTPATGYGLNAALQGRRGVVAWEVGADVRLADGTEHERFRYLGGAFTRVREAGGKALTAGAYAEAVADSGPWLLTGGLRLDRSRAYDAVRREWDAATGTLLLDAPGRTRSDTSPTARLGLRYAWSDDLHVRAAAYAGFRPPTLNELHRPFRVGNDVTEANPVLKPETLRGIEVGAGGEGAVRWSATLFYNRLSDPIANVTLGVGPETFPNAGFIPAGGTLRQRQNIGKIKAIGVEGEASGGGEAFSWRAAFAYVDAEVDGGQPAPQLTGLRPSQAPRWTVTGGLQFRPTATISLAADLRYESLRFEDDLNSRRLAPGVTLDARAGWRLRGDADVYVAADNLFGARLEVGETADGVGTYAAPRTIRIGLSIRR